MASLPPCLSWEGRGLAVGFLPQSFLCCSLLLVLLSVVDVLMVSGPVACGGLRSTQVGSPPCA